MNSNLSPECLLEIIKIQTEIVQQGLDLGGVMPLVAQRAQHLTGAAGAVVELAEGDEMVYRAVSGIAEPQLGLRLKMNTSLSGLCIKAAHPLVCRDSETDDRVNREACRRVGLRSMIVAPLKHGDTVVGVLKVLSSRKDAFDETAIRILELMSELIAASMFNAAKYESNELFRRATYDQLTDVANRALFYDRLRQRLAQAQRASERFAVIMLDMDGLKQINDRFGHRAGDAAIKEFALRIKSVPRQADTVARLGGDEFGIILHKIEKPEEAELLIGRLENALSAPFRFEQRGVVLRASSGYAIFPDDGVEVDTLIEKADRSMYDVKRVHKELARQIQ